ncbi:hypothetical protein [Ralstonia pickettii]|nr:hypothetical protein [Ralstonia pickettii]
MNDAADDESIQIIGNGLNHFNDTQVGYGDRRATHPARAAFSSARRCE